MADMHRYQVQCICSTAWSIANAVVVVFKSQRYVQEQPQLTKHLPDYFVLSSLNRSHGTLFCSRFRTEGRCSEKHLCKKYNDFRPTSCKIHAELDMPFANFNRLKLKASLSLPPSPFDVSAIFYSCVFLYLLIIQHFQQLKSGVFIWIPFVPLVLQMHASSLPGHVACFRFTANHCWIETTLRANRSPQHTHETWLCTCCAWICLCIVLRWSESDMISCVTHGDDIWCPSSFMTAQRGRTLPPQSILIPPLSPCQSHQ